MLYKLSELIDPDHQRLIWLAWSGEHLPEELSGKVEVLYKPLTRSRLLALSLPNTVEEESPLAQVTLSGRILLVDDNPTNLKAMSEQLKHSGLVLDHASNGVQAVQACLERQYDLVLMDVQMSEMDGLEATRQIREKLAGQAPQIIGVSAHVLEEDFAKAREAGMSEYLTKPVRQSILLTKIMEYLS